MRGLRLLSAASHCVLAAALAVCAAQLGCTQGDNGGADTASSQNARLAASLTPREIEERISQAQTQSSQGDFEGAVETLRPVVSRPSVEPRILFQYGTALVNSGRPSLGLWHLARAAEGAAPESPASIAHARALLTGGDPDAAIRKLGTLIEAAPENTALRSLRARAYQRGLQYEAAIDDLDVIVDLDSKELAALEARIQILTELDEIAGARDSIEELRRRLDEVEAPAAIKGRACAAGARFEQQHGDPARAEPFFQECLAAHPIEPDVVMPWVLFLEERGERERATAELEAVVEGAGRKRLRLRLALGQRYAALGRREDVRRTLEEAAEELRVPQPLFALADHAVSWGDLETARSAVHSAIGMQLGKKPGDDDFSWSDLPVEGRFAFGDILIQAGEKEEAGEIIRSLEGDESEEVYVQLLNGRIALEDGDPQRAVDLFEASFKYWPSNIAARYLAGLAAMQLGDFDRGLRFYQDAFRADPLASDAGIVLARMQNAQGLRAAAADTLTTLLGKTAEDPKAMRLFASMLGAIGAVETATTTREDLALRLGQVDQAAADQAAQILALGDLNLAISYLEEPGSGSPLPGDPTKRASALANPDHFESWLTWYALQAEKGEVSRIAARARIRELRAGSPNSAGVELLWARVLRTFKEDLPGAIEAARAAVERNDAFLEAWVDLGRLLLEAGETEAAAEAFERASELDPRDLGAAMGMADVARKRGRLDEARELYRSTLHAHPYHGAAAAALALLALEAGDVGDQTLVHARWAARFHEGEAANGAILLARVHLARDEAAEASVAAQRAIEASQVPDATPIYLLGRALTDLGDTDNAIDALEDSLKVPGFPEEDDARALLGRLRAGGAQ